MFFINPLNNDFWYIDYGPKNSTPLKKKLPNVESRNWGHQKNRSLGRVRSRVAQVSDATGGDHSAVVIGIEEAGLLRYADLVTALGNGCLPIYCNGNCLEEGTLLVYPGLEVLGFITRSKGRSELGTFVSVSG